MVDWRAIGAIMSVGMFVIAAMTVIGLVQVKEGIPSPGFDDLDTDTYEKGFEGWKGSGDYDGEIFTRSAYILSHRANGRSQDIGISGSVRRPDWFACTLDSARFWLYLSKDGKTWTPMKDSKGNDVMFESGVSGGLMSDHVTFDPFVLNVVGYRAEGAIKVKFEIHCKELLKDMWGKVGEDYAYLRNSIGDISASKQAAIGETITVIWQIPYITAEGGAGAEGEGETGFYLIGNHLDTGKEIVNKKLKSLQGNFKYKVLSEDWVPGSGGECADNIIRWRLLNELWNIDWQDTTTIDVAGAGPIVKDLKWDKGTYNVGDTATLSWDVELGPEGYDISHQKVIWGFGEPITETEVNSTIRSYTTEGLGQAGELHGEVIAYDTACRPSAVADTYANVQDPNTPPTPPGGSSSIAWIFALAFAILLSIIILYIVSSFVDVGGWINYVILAVIWLAVAIPLYYGLLIVFEAVEALI